MNHIPRKNLFYVSFLSTYLLTAPVVGQKPASQPASRPAKVKITISRKTTYVLGPVNADGTVNYVAAINKMCSKGVTPKNNAAVLLIRAVGPGAISEFVSARTYKILKMQPLSKKGNYFQGLYSYEKAHNPKWREDSSLEDVDEHLKKAMKAPWSAKDHPITAGWLKANEDPLAMVVAAGKRRRYYFPYLSLSKPPLVLDMLFPSLGQWSMTKALVARAMLKAGTGDIKAARVDLMAVHQLARLIGQGPMLVDRVVAIWIDIYAYDAAAALATSGKLTATQAKGCLTDLQSLPALPGVTEAIDKTERFYLLDTTMFIARKGILVLKGFLHTLSEEEMKTKSLPDQYLPLDWDLILTTINQRYDRMVAAFRKPSFAERKQAFTVFQRDVEKLKKRTADKIGSLEKWKQWERKINSLSGKPTAARREVSEAMADFLISRLMPTHGRASELYDEAIMKRRVAEIALALAACKAETGEYPAGLAELTPKYLKKIPNDLFIEKPLHYKRTNKGYLLYSVGPDMKDDGGKKKGDGKDCDDIVVRVK